MASRKKLTPSQRLKSAGSSSQESTVREPVDLSKYGIKSVDEAAVLVTEAMADELLGWTTDPTHVKQDPLFDDKGDAKLGKVWCSNNTINRWFDLACAYKYAQDMLMKRWKRNGESISIGVTQQVLSGQKRLVAVKIANALLRKDKHHWEEYWPGGEVTFESVIICGVSEDHDTLRTFDNVQPRTLADVIYTELGAFADKKPFERRQLTKMTEHAIKCLWCRMGIKDDFIEFLTHSEAVDFLKRHMRVFDAVEHIWQEDDNKSIGNYIPVGYGSGLMYLFATSDTDAEDYFAIDTTTRTEKQVNFDQWDKACEFFTLLSKGTDEKFVAVRTAIGDMFDEDTGSGGRISEKETILIKAWNHFKADDEELVDTPPIKYIKRNDVTSLGEFPTVGGLDIGKPDKAKKSRKGRKETPETESEDTSSEDVKKSMEEEKAKKMTGVLHMTKIAELKEKHKGKLLLFEGDKNYYTWADDADIITEEFGQDYDRQHPAWGEVKRASFPKSDFAINTAQLIKNGKQVMLVIGDIDDVKEVRDLVSSKASDKTNGKPQTKPVETKKSGITPVRSKIKTTLRGGA